MVRVGDLKRFMHFHENLKVCLFILFRRTLKIYIGIWSAALLYGQGNVGKGLSTIWHVYQVGTNVKSMLSGYNNANY